MKRFNCTETMFKKKRDYILNTGLIKHICNLIEDVIG